MLRVGLSQTPQTQASKDFQCCSCGLHVTIGSINILYVVLHITETEGMEPKSATTFPSLETSWTSLLVLLVKIHSSHSHFSCFRELFGFPSEALKYDGFVIIIAVHFSITSKCFHMYSLSHQKPDTVLALGTFSRSKFGI